MLKYQLSSLEIDALKIGLELMLENVFYDPEGIDSLQYPSYDDILLRLGKNYGYFENTMFPERSFSQRFRSWVRSLGLQRKAKHNGNIHTN